MITLGDIKLTNLTLGGRNVSTVYLQDNKIYPDETPVEDTYSFCIEFVDGSGEIEFNSFLSSSLHPSLEYKIDDGEWTNIVWEDDWQSITFEGEKVYFRGNNPNGFSNANSQVHIRPQHSCRFSGDIMSLVYPTEDLNTKVIPSYCCFQELFDGEGERITLTEYFRLSATVLKDHCYDRMFDFEALESDLPSNFVLPATTLAPSCYYMMFANNPRITELPQGMLPATTLAEECYMRMFNECYNIQTIPDDFLPATELADECYQEMFYYCDGLKSIPYLLLPATTLADSCYQSMFERCTELREAPLLPATELANNCYFSMFKDCYNLMDLSQGVLPATTLVDGCYQSMFSNCTSLTQAPYLPASTLVGECYTGMFYGCANLNYIKVGATSWNTQYVNHTRGWVQGVSSTGTFVKHATVNIPVGIDGIPNGWVVENIEYTAQMNVIYPYTFIGNTTETIATLDKSISTNNDITLTINNVSFTSNPSYDNDAFIGTIGGTQVHLVWDVYTPTNELKLHNIGSNFILTSFNMQVDGEDVIIYEMEAIEPVTIIARTATTVSISGNGTFNNSTITYQVDEGDEKAYSLNQSIMLSTGQRVKFRGYSGTWGTSDANFGQFRISGEVEVRGNVNSLLTGNKNVDEMPSFCFYRLFGDNTSIVKADHLQLPAKTLNQRSYSQMFRNCSNMLTANLELPATTLGRECYTSMFYMCKALNQPPEILPKATPAYQSYTSMFQGCSALWYTPKIYTNPTSENTFGGMFNGCTSLKLVRNYSTSWTTAGAVDWLKSVGSGGYFIRGGGVSTSTYTTGTSGIPSGWSNTTPTSTKYRYALSNVQLKPNVHELRDGDKIAIRHKSDTNANRFIGRNTTTNTCSGITASTSLTTNLGTSIIHEVLANDDDTFYLVVLSGYYLSWKSKSASEGAPYTFDTSTAKLKLKPRYGDEGYWCVVEQSSGSNWGLNNLYGTWRNQNFYSDDPLTITGDDNSSYIFYKFIDIT